MHNQIQPTENRILFSLHGMGETESNIVLPEGSLRPLPYGKVLAVGPEVKGIVVGDLILFSPHADPICFSHVTPPVYMITEGTVFAKYFPKG